MSLPSELHEIRGRLELAYQTLLLAANRVKQAHDSNDVRDALGHIRAAHEGAKAARENLNAAGVLAKAETEKQGRLF